LKRWCIVIFSIGLAFLIAAEIVSVRQDSFAPRRPAPNGNTQFITVEPNVELEVIDFGGTGRPLVLLAGLGGTAHDFGGFSAKLATKYHVYGITRRGFGLSSIPASGYGAKRLGDDVVAVIDTLKLVRPILVGASVAGEELSSVATFHSNKVGALIYLDAGYHYAVYDPDSWQPAVDVGFAIIAVGRMLEPLIPATLESKRVAVYLGARKFTELHVPVLAIFADPHDLSAKYKDAGQCAKAEALDFERTERQVNAFRRRVPSARIVRLPHASHLIWFSNEADVWKAMSTFVDSLH
jgi:pimeloyl-ACP methyl ester carboxylesterase